jgi:hypothetical protein
MPASRLSPRRQQLVAPVAPRWPQQLRLPQRRQPVAARFSVRPLARLSVAVLFSPVLALVLRQAQAHSSLTRPRSSSAQHQV